MTTESNSKDPQHSDDSTESGDSAQQANSPESPGEQDDAAAASLLKAALAKNRTAQLVTEEEVSGKALLASVGGVRGMIEASLPALVFLIAFLVSGGDMMLSLVPSVGAALLIAVIRLLSKGDLTGSFAGIAGLSISALLAIATGNIENNFLLGLITNATLLLAMLLSVLLRRPLIGVLFGSIYEDSSWRSDKRRFRLLVWATLLWAGVAAVRLSLQLPLYLAGEVAWLATARIALGLPLYLAAIWLTWLLVSAAFRASKQSDAT